VKKESENFPKNLEKLVKITLEKTKNSKNLPILSGKLKDIILSSE
jgi:hypothetical protein